MISYLKKNEKQWEMHPTHNINKSNKHANECVSLIYRKLEEESDLNGVRHIMLWNQKNI